MLTRRQWMGTALGVAAATNLAARVPRKAGKVVITLTGGEQLTLRSFTGKVVALEFLLTTCTHCQRCSGILQKLYEEFGPQGFQPLGAAMNDDAAKLVPEFIRKLGLKYPVGATPRVKAYEFLGVNFFEPVLTPQLVFIDRGGMVRAQYGGESDFFKDEEANMRKAIESLLAAR